MQETKLVLYFDIENAATRRRVCDCLTHISPKTRDKLYHCLKAGRLVIKRRADPLVDHRIVAKLEAAGGVCRFETDGEETAPEPRSSSSAGPGIVCPKCLRRQAPGLECRYCGIIFQKIKNRTPKEGPGDCFAQSPAMSMDTPSRERLRLRVGRRLRRAGALICPGDAAPGICVWFRRLRDAMSRLTLVVIIGFMLETALLYFFNGMWFVYTHTPVGQHYLTLADGAGESLQALFQSDLVMLAIRITLTALAVCLVAGAAGRLAMLQRYFFIPFGLLGRILVWTLPLTVLIARHLEAGDPVMVFPVAFGLALFPVAVLLKCTFILARLLVPELSTVCAVIRRLIGQIIGWVGSRQRRLVANRR